MNFINGHLLLDQLFLKHAKKEACISAVEFLSLSSPPTMQTILPPLLRAVDLTLNFFLQNEVPF